MGDNPLVSNSYLDSNPPLMPRSVQKGGDSGPVTPAVLIDIGGSGEESILSPSNPLPVSNSASATVSLVDNVLAEAGSTALVINATGHGAQVGNLIFDSTGITRGQIRTVKSVTADTITVDRPFLNTPYEGDAFGIYIQTLLQTDNNGVIVFPSTAILVRQGDPWVVTFSQPIAILLPDPLRFFGNSASDVTGTGDTQIGDLGGAGDGLSYSIANISVSNSHASVSTRVYILDGSTIIWQGAAAAGCGGFESSFPLNGELLCSANSPLKLRCETTGAAVRASVSGRIV